MISPSHLAALTKQITKVAASGNPALKGTSPSMEMFMGKWSINEGFSIVKLCPGKSNGAMAKMHHSYTLTYNFPIQQIAHVQPCQQVSQSPPTSIAQVASAGSSQPTLGLQECATLGASQYMARRGRAARAGNSCWLVCQRAKPPATCRKWVVPVVICCDVVNIWWNQGKGRLWWTMYVLSDDSWWMFFCIFFDFYWYVLNKKRW